MEQEKPKEEVDEELEEFIKKFKKDVVRLQNVAPLMNRIDIGDKIGIFYNALYSYQLSKSTKYLAYATIVLAGASVLQIINAIYGPTFTNDFIIGIVRAIIYLIMGMVGLKVLLDISKGTLSWIKRKFKK